MEVETESFDSGISCAEMGKGINSNLYGWVYRYKELLFSELEDMK